MSNTLRSRAEVLFERIRPPHRKARPSPFFRLPAELRNAIYELLLKSDDMVDPCARCEKRCSGCNEGLQPQLLQVCRQIYEEARAVLYGQNVILLNFNKLRDYYSVWAWTRRMQPGTIACLRRVRLRMGTMIDLPCVTNAPDYYAHRAQVLRRWSPLSPSSHSYRLIEAYRASVELAIGFGRQQAIYTNIRVFEVLDIFMARPSYSSRELVVAANNGLVSNLPTDYAVPERPTMRDFGVIVGMFTSGQDRMTTPNFVHRLLAGEMAPLDPDEEDWHRWKEVLVDLDIIKETKSDARAKRKWPKHYWT